MTEKARLSASVDTDLLAAARAAVTAGRADNLSAWVNEALRLKADHDRRLGALAAFVAAFEDAHGEITGDELATTVRRARADAVVVRGKARPRRGSGAA